MCGIAGISLRNPNPKALEEMTKIIKDLANTCGNSSWGIATALNGNMYLTKEVGRIPDKILVDQTVKQLGELPYTTMIGHTRRPTVGAVSRKNAHPFLNEDNSIALVHNGNVFTHLEMSKALDPNHKFSSETDSEVLLHGFEYFMESFMKSKPESKTILQVTVEVIQKVFERCRMSNAIYMYGDGTLVAYAGSKLWMYRTPEAIYLATVPVKEISKENWIKLPDDTILIVRNGEILLNTRLESTVQVKEIKEEADRITRLVKALKRGFHYDFGYATPTGPDERWDLEPIMSKGINSSYIMCCPKEDKIHPVNRYKAHFCVKCNTWYCRGHEHNPKNHPCVKGEKR